MAKISLLLLSALLAGTVWVLLHDLGPASTERASTSRTAPAPAVGPSSEAILDEPASGPGALREREPAPATGPGTAPDATRRAVGQAGEVLERGPSLELEVRVVDVDSEPVGGVIVWAEAPDSKKARLEEWARLLETGWAVTGGIDADARRTATNSQGVRLHRPGAARGDVFVSSSPTAGPVQTVAGRATLAFSWPRPRGRIVVRAGGPWLPPMEAVVDADELGEEPLELRLPPFGTLVVELDPTTEGAMLVPGRLAAMPDRFVASTEPSPRPPLELPLFGLGQELDVHVVVLDNVATTVRTRRLRDPAGSGLVDFDLELSAPVVLHTLSADGSSTEALPSGERHARRVVRLFGPRSHGERRVETLRPGPPRVELRGTLVDAEDWNLGNFTADFTVTTERGTHRYRRDVFAVGDFRLCLPLEVSEEGLLELAVQGDPAQVQRGDHRGTIPLTGVVPGPNELGKLTLRPLPLLVSGRVLGPDGAPRSGLPLVLYERVGAGRDDAPPAWRALPGPPAGHWRTDRKGTFELLGVPGTRPLGLHVQGAVDAGAAPLEFAAPSVGLELVLETVDRELEGG